MRARGSFGCLQITEDLGGAFPLPGFDAVQVVTDLSIALPADPDPVITSDKITRSAESGEDGVRETKRLNALPLGSSSFVHLIAREAGTRRPVTPHDTPIER